MRAPVSGRRKPPLLYFKELGLITCREREMGMWHPFVLVASSSGPGWVLLPCCWYSVTAYSRVVVGGVLLNWICAHQCDIYGIPFPLPHRSNHRCIPSPHLLTEGPGEMGYAWTAPLCVSGGWSNEGRWDIVSLVYNL